MEKNLARRAGWIFKTLRKTYPNAHCELNYKNSLELLVATVLSAQCTDKRVNLVTQELFKKYKTARDYASGPLTKLEAMIRSTGFYKNKSKNIRGACRAIEKEFGGRVPETMAALVSLPGLGRKSANVILGNVFGKQEGITVDTHVIRLSNLLGLTQERNPERIERDLMKLFPIKNWTLISHLLVWHGRRCCVARRPDCLHCPVRPNCPAGLKVREKK